LGYSDLKHWLSTEYRNIPISINIVFVLMLYFLLKNSLYTEGV
jgi:hypothetical protein